MLSNKSLIAIALINKAIAFYPKQIRLELGKGEIIFIGNWVGRDIFDNCQIAIASRN